VGISEDRAELNLSQGEITVTTPSDAARHKMIQLSKKLDAVVIGEEDNLPIRSQTGTGMFANRQTWIGWPIFVVVLSALLIWKRRSSHARGTHE
jgi:hypothetical protein